MALKIYIISPTLLKKLSSQRLLGLVAIQRALPVQHSDLTAIRTVMDLYRSVER